jgi:hypothetical protein
MVDDKVRLHFLNGDVFVQGKMFMFENGCIGVIQYIGVRPLHTIYPLHLISKIDVLKDEYKVGKYYKKEI